MKKSQSIFIVFFLLPIAFCYTQTRDIHQDEHLVFFKKSIQNTFLIQNNDHLVPLADISPNRIFVLGQNEQSFQLLNYANLYADVHMYDKSKPSACDGCTLIIPQFKDLHLNSEFSAENIQHFAELKQRLGLRIIWLNFGNPASLDNMAINQISDALIYAKQDDDMHRFIAIQAIFGGQNIASKEKNESALASNEIPKTRLGYASPGFVGMNSQILHDSISKIANEGIANQAFPGLQVLVVRKNQIVFHECYGYLTYDSIEQVNRSHIYDLASVSKISTALPALIKLHGEHKYHLDSPLEKYVPSFKKSNKAKLSGRELLSHQGGLIPHISHWVNAKRKNGTYRFRTFKQKPSDKYSIKITDSLHMHKRYRNNMYKSIRKSSLLPEKTYKYSGLYFYLLPDIIESISGQPYAQFLKDEIYNPIGANIMGFNPLNRFPIEKMVPTEIDTFWRFQMVRGRVHDEGAAMMNGESANAGLFSNANDLAKLLQLYLNEGTYGAQTIFSETSFEEFSKYQYPEKGNRRGLGFDKPPLDTESSSYISKQASAQSFGHSGFTGTFVWADPREELIIIFLSNRVYPYRSHRKLYALNIRPRIHDVLYQSIED